MRKSRMGLALVLALLLAAVLTACGESDSGDTGGAASPEATPRPSISTSTATGDLSEAIPSVPALSGLAQALQTSGLSDELDGEYTLFAPSDDAFSQLGQDQVQALIEDGNRLEDVLNYHVVEGKYDLATVQLPDMPLTLQGSHLIITAG